MEKERTEEVLENLDSLERRQKIRKTLVVAIICVLLAIIVFLGVSFYLYFQSPEKTLGIGANIESALLSSDGKTAYLKLAGESDKNITKIKFIFTDENGNYKTLYIILSLLAVIILIIVIIIVKIKKDKKRKLKTRKKKYKKKIGKRTRR